MVSNVIQMRITPAAAKKRIAEAAKDSAKVIFTRHANERSDQRCITRKQVIHCLIHGRFTEAPCWDQIHGGYKFTMQTVDSGERVNVAAALYKNDKGDYVVVITVF